MDLAFFSIQKLELFLLVLVRTMAIFTLTPIFGSNQIPVHVRVAIGFGLALVFVPMVGAVSELPVDVLPLGVMAVREACVGLVIGFVCNMIFAALQTAGQFVDLQSGFAFATMLDPVNGANAAVAGRFNYLVAGLLFFATNAHHVLIRGLADSFGLAPVGQVGMNHMVAGGMLDLFAGLFAVSLQIAFPVIAAVFLADVAFAIVSRVVPQMNILIVGFPLKLGIGLVGMLLALPVLAAMSRGLFGDMYGHITGLVRIFAIH